VALSPSWWLRRSGPLSEHGRICARPPGSPRRILRGGSFAQALSNVHLWYALSFIAAHRLGSPAACIQERQRAVHSLDVLLLLHCIVAAESGRVILSGPYPHPNPTPQGEGEIESDSVAT
jgi:hypothetical protein